MNEQQRQTIRDFIELHNSKVSTHLCSMGLLNNNGTLPRGDGVQINLERWFFDSINSDNYTFSVNDAGGVEVNLEIRGFDSHSGNPVIFEFDAAIWPSLFEEAVSVWVEDGVVKRPDVFIEPHIMVDICGENLAESYKTLFIDEDLGAIADLPGMILNGVTLTDQLYAKPTALQELVGKLIDAEQDRLLKAVMQYATDLTVLDENGDITPESRAESLAWLDDNGLKDRLQKVFANGGK